ncbi:sulfurtransferase TusA family protein [Variovorax paradoxus]|uniref:sulfurtransferase TusA family protein n=1 Tax=Variovorax paradoxus TaxID=34073 RepID=UPI0029C8704C|nr:sulfurtransferase TusA family protein [Variovorax paradoxus]
MTSPLPHPSGTPFLPARPVPKAPGAGDPVHVDARGTRCPVPILRLRKAVGRSMPGQVIVLVTDDPSALANVQQALGWLPAQLFAIRREDDRVIFTLLRQ